MKRIADSFTWPLHPTSRGTWAMGVVAVTLLPLFFIPVLGYAVAAVRAAQRDTSAGPPAWRWSWRLIRDGAWVALALAITAAPFVVACVLLAPGLAARWGAIIGDTVAVSGLLLLWGVVLLLLAPHATAAFAATGKVRDLFNAGASVRAVIRDFATWNLVAAAIVTGWALGIAFTAAVCVGFLPGVFYAILVSAHASAALHGPRSDPSAG